MFSFLFDLCISGLGGDASVLSYGPDSVVDSAASRNANCRAFVFRLELFSSRLWVQFP